MELSVTWAVLSTVLGASLLGSLHCAAMCGPFVMVYSGGTDPQPRSQALSHLAYHGGRAVTYLGLGAVAGALGATVDWAFEAVGLVRVAALVSGALVILWGLGALLPVLGRRGGKVRSPLTNPLRRTLVKLGTRPRVVRAGTLGALTPLLPCGWLYAFVLTAAGTGSALSGLMVMLAFFLGTVPALLGIGLASGRLARLMRPRMPLLTAVALVVVGLSAVVSRALMPLPAEARTEGSHAAAQIGGDPTEALGAGHRCH